MNTVAVLVGGPFDGQKVSVSMGQYHEAHAVVMRELKPLSDHDLNAPIELSHKGGWTDHRYFVMACMKPYNEGLLVFRHESVTEDLAMVRLITTYAKKAGKPVNGKPWSLEA